jgi:hypothetical protein
MFSGLTCPVVGSNGFTTQTPHNAATGYYRRRFFGFLRNEEDDVTR